MCSIKISKLENFVNGYEIKRAYKSCQSLIRVVICANSWMGREHEFVALTNIHAVLQNNLVSFDVAPAAKSIAHDGKSTNRIPRYSIVGLGPFP